MLRLERYKNEKRRDVDLLVEKFWKHGYMTVSRRFGTYLPEPSKVGRFDVDIIARHKNDYAIGITLSENDLNDPDIIDKITFLATRQTRFGNKKVLLFIGIPLSSYKNAKQLISTLGEEIRKNIKLFYFEKDSFTLRKKEKQQTLFS